MEHNYKSTEKRYSDSHVRPGDISLARPYVKNQVYNELYRFSTALKLGTIFPELDLWDSELYNKEQYIRPNKKYGGYRNGKHEMYL